MVKTKSGGADEDVVRQVLADVPGGARDAFVQSVTDADDVDESLWGGAPSRVSSQTAAMTNLQRQFESRRRLVDNSVTRADAAALLSISEQAVSALAKAGDLVTIKVGRQLRVPAWQFHPDMERGFLPGVARLAAVFPGGVTALSEWMVRPNVELGNVTPAAALATGQVDAVVNVARYGTAAAW